MPATPIYFDDLTLADMVDMLRHAGLELVTDTHGRLCARHRAPTPIRAAVQEPAPLPSPKRAWPPKSGGAA